MRINRVVLVVGLTLIISLSGCSRQQSDWEKTRAANTTDSYELFLKKYPNGEFTAQAQARVKELYEERGWQKARDADTPEAYQAFLKQYPEGKWTEEARIRVENFSLAQVPSGSSVTAGDAAGASAGAASAGAASARAAATGSASQDSSAASPPPKDAMTAGTPMIKPAASTMKAAAKADVGSYGVQLGAFKSSADAANQRWSDLAKKYPKLLGSLLPKVSPKKSSSGTLYRLQVINLSEQHARALCKSLQSSAQACVIVPPSRT